VFYVESDDCNLISNFVINKNLFTLNTSESVEFLPSGFEYLDSDWEDINNYDDSLYSNEIVYNKKELESLSDTDLKISDDELTDAIHTSLIHNEILNDVISVFPNRYTVRTLSTKINVYSFKYGVYINVVNTKCEKYQIKYKYSEIKGMICKISFVSGVRYGVKCGNIKLDLMPIDDNGKLECQTRCKE